MSAQSMNVEITEQDHADGQRLHVRKTRKVWRVVRFASWLVFALLAAHSAYEEDWRNVALFFSVFVALVFLYVFDVVFFRRRLRRLYAQSKRLFSHMRYEWDDEGFSGLGSDRIHWDEIVKTYEDDKVYLIYNTDLSFFIFPKRDINYAPMIEDVKERILRAR